MKVSLLLGELAILTCTLRPGSAVAAVGAAKGTGTGVGNGRATGLDSQAPA